MSNTSGEGMLMGLVRFWIVIVAMAVIGLSLCGCPALMIPGLAYSGYQYEKTGSITGQPAASSSPSHKAAAQPTPTDTSIE